MASYKILSTGNTIVADEEYVNLRYPNDWELIPEPEVVEPTPTPVTVLTKLEFMNRFTDLELVTLYSAAKTSVPLEIWLEKFKLASEVDITDQRTIDGIAALETVGILAVGRAAEILG
jgi:hypothetical protein